jgi:catenin alpha
VVLWKMKAPAKKPLVRREDQAEMNAKVRKGAKGSHIEPLKALSEFQEVAPDSYC